MVLVANKNDCFNLNVAGRVIPSSSEVKLLEITIDYELKFKKHINELCRKASYKLHALLKIRRYLSVVKARLLANAFIDSHFNYVPLIWMFAGKKLIKKICKIHHRTLQVVYNDFNKSYDELLEKNKDLPIYQKRSYFAEKPMSYNLRDGCKLVTKNKIFTFW